MLECVRIDTSHGGARRLVGARHEHGARTAVAQRAHDRLDLAGRLALGEDRFGRPLPGVTLQVDLCEPEVGEAHAPTAHSSRHSARSTEQRAVPSAVATAARIARSGKRPLSIIPERGDLDTCARTGARPRRPVRARVTAQGALRGRIGLLVAVALAALTLRPQLVGLGPVLPRAQDALGVSHAVAALLATIPVVGMGVFAPAAAPLAARVGAIRAVTVALALIAIGGVGRSLLPGAVAAIALTVPIGIGMGLGNALMVVAVKERFADRPVLVTGIYASGIQIGAAISAGLAVPLADAGDSWRTPMLAFSLAAAVSLAWWLATTRGGGPRPVGKRAHFPLRKPVAWLLVWLFASTSFVYYGYASWLPDAFTEHGWSESHAAQLALAINTCAIVTSISVTLVGDRFHWSRRTLLIPPCVFYAAGALGIAIDPSHALFWACVTGCGNGAIFPLMMTLPLDAADRPEQVAGVVGMMLGIGYCFGALAPLALGALRDVTGSFEAGLWAIALAAIISLVCGASCSPARLARGVRDEPAVTPGGAGLPT